MCDQDTVRVPLRARDGSTRAHAHIDAADAGWANQWRWALSEGYAYRTERRDGKKHTVWLHRALLGLKAGDRVQVDHVDRDRLNCRRANMRVVPKGANSQNVPANAGSTSRFRGISWDRARGKWMAQVKAGRKRLTVGRFDDEEAAAEAARLARLRVLEYALD